MKIAVTVELTFDRLPDEAARQLAREIVEGRGLEVTKRPLDGDRADPELFRQGCGGGESLASFIFPAAHPAHDFLPHVFVQNGPNLSGHFASLSCRYTRNTYTNALVVSIPSLL